MTSLADAMDLIRRGDLAAAGQLLDRLAGQRPHDPTVWLAKAAVARGLLDEGAERGALQAALHHDPENLSALLLRGDLEGRSGDDRSAARFYTSALRVASANPPPVELHPALNQAQRFLVEAAIGSRTRLRLPWQKPTLMPLICRGWQRRWSC